MKSTSTNLYACYTTALAIAAAALFVFPGASVVHTLLKLAGAGFLATLLYRRVSAPSFWGHCVLTGAWTLLAIGLAANVWYFTTYSGGTVYDPVLINDDAASAWRQMQAVLSGQDSGVGMSRRGYGTFLALLAWPGPADIASELCFNVLLILVAIVLTGAAAVRLTPGVAPQRTATAAMLMTAMVCYFLSTGVILIKDALICAIMASAVYACAGLRSRFSRADIALVFAGGLVAALVRPNLLPLLCLGLLIFAPGMDRRRIAALGACVAVFAALYFITRHIGLRSEVFSDTHTPMVEMGTEQPRLESYNSVLGNYNELPLWRQLVQLPVSLALQFLTPLPWAFSRDVVFGPSAAFAHISFPWYALGGILLYYAVALWRRSPRGVALSFGYGLLLTMLTAFMTGGTISRYCLPWLPALVPAAAWAWNSGCLRRRSFKIWYVVYALLMAVALCAAFAILNRYNPGGWDAK